MVSKSSCTIHQVAQKAGVSIGTVSRVLNNHPSVSPKCREAVQLAIRELDYRPDQMARSIRRTTLDTPGRVRTGNVGMIFINTATEMLSLPFMARMAHGIQRELFSRGYHMIVDHTEDPVSIPASVRDGKTEGIIIHGDMSADLCESLAKLQPIVVIGRNSTGIPMNSVNVDNFNAIGNAVRYLRQLGHHRIGFVCCDPQHADFEDRLIGFRLALKTQGLASRPEYEFVAATTTHIGPVAPQPTPPNMDEQLRPIASMAERPTALIVANDWQAIGVYQTLKTMGMTLPKDMSIVGFDDDARLCEIVSPPLTSMNYPAEQMGRTAVQLLMKAVDRSSTSAMEAVLIQSTLHERVSCCPPQ